MLKAPLSRRWRALELIRAPNVYQNKIYGFLSSREAFKQMERIDRGREGETMWDVAKSVISLGIKLI